jgi:capsular polysaccharide biosynthesis protein
MNLNDYARIIRRRGWLILLLAVLTAGVAFVFSRAQEPEYTATARLLITSRPDFGQTQAAKALVRDYAAWLNSSYRAADVIDELQLDMTPNELKGQVTVAAASAESIIMIEAENTRPDVAVDIARSWAEQLIFWRNEQNAGLRQEDRIGAELIDDPVTGAPSPNARLNAVAGAVFGALLGIILIFLLEWLDSGVVRRPDDVERYLDLPVVGTIPGSN